MRSKIKIICIVFVIKSQNKKSIFSKQMNLKNSLVQFKQFRVVRNNSKQFDQNSSKQFREEFNLNRFSSTWTTFKIVWFNLLEMFNSLVQSRRTTNAVWIIRHSSVWIGQPYLGLMPSLMSYVMFFQRKKCTLYHASLTYIFLVQGWL